MSSGRSRNGASAWAIDLVSAAEAVEVVDVERAEIDLHRLEEILQRDALLLGFHAINVGVELRDVDGEGGEHAGEAGSLIALADDRLHGLVKGVVAEVGAVLDVELEAADGAEAHARAAAAPRG